MRTSKLLGAALVAVAAVVVPVQGPAVAGPPGPDRPSSAPPPAQPGSPRSGDTIALGPSYGRVSLRTGPVSVPKGTGPENGATFTSFGLTDRVALGVNAGSGNLLLRTNDLTLPGISGDVVLGAAYNSLLVGSEVESGAFGRGWRSRAGADVKLLKGGDGSMTYLAADGVVGRFTPTSSGYTTPGQFKGTLAIVGDGWRFTENDSGRESYFTADGLLDRTLDRNDNITDYTYNAAGELTRVMSDRGATGARTVTVSWSGGKLTRIDQTGDASAARSVQYAYNGRGNLAQILPSSGRAVRFGYDTSQRVNKITTAFGTEPGTETRIDYDSQHRVSAVTRVLVSESDDDEGSLAVTRWAYLSATETRTADANTDLTKRVTDVPHTRYTVNDEKRVTEAVDPAGKTRSKVYTPYHDVTSSTDGTGQSTTHTYGANGQQSRTRTSTPTGASTSTAYGNAPTSTNPTAGFQPSATTDAQQNQSTYTYNGAGNRLSATNAEAAQADVDYNADGTVRTTTDPANTGNPSRYAYNADKQLLSVTPPTGNSLGRRDFTYDAYGRLRTATDGAGRTLAYEYDTDDRTTRISYSDGTAAVGLRYDGAGNLTQRTDALGSETFVFDRLNRLIQRGSATYPYKYTYDPVGNLTRLQAPGRGATDYRYDDRNLLTEMSVDDSWMFYRFTYDDEGRRTGTRLLGPSAGPATVASTQNTYDHSGRLTRTTSKRWQKVNGADQESTVHDVSFCYAKRVGTAACSTDKAQDTGIRQWATEHHRGGAVQVYTYDRSNRLTRATSLASGAYDYTYDGNGNRTSVKLNGTETQRLTFNSANQITTSGYTYDGAGNQTAGSRAAGATYNAAGQTTGVDTSSGRYTFEYAGGDQTELDSARSGSDYSHYNWGRMGGNGVPTLQEYLAGPDSHFIESDGSGTPIGLQVHTKSNDTWQGYFLVLDGLGSVVGLVDRQGALAGTYTYDPYGRTTATVTNDPVVTGFGLGFAGGLRKGSLVKFGQRWYDTETGRFTQQDPSGLEPNRYAYAAANPVNYTDPTGLLTRCGGMSILVGLAVTLMFGPAGALGVLGTTLSFAASTGVSMGFAALCTDAP